MIINIDANTRIEAGTSNYTLQYRKKSKNGALNWATDGYFPNLTQCATEALNNAPGVSTQATIDLNSLIETINKAEKKIALAIKGLEKK